MLCNRRTFESKNKAGWFAGIMIYSELQNPYWTVNERLAKRLLKVTKKLPFYNKGVPGFISKLYKGCTLTDSEDFTLQCFDGILIICDRNMIEFREDIDYVIEREILKSVPDEIYKKVYHYI